MRSGEGFRAFAAVHSGRYNLESTMRKFLKAGVSAVATLPVAAFAALPTGVDTAITSATTDGTTLIGLLAAAGAAVYLIAKLLKRFGVML